MRVYWYQVPGRFVTYIRLNSHKMYEYGVTKEEIFQLVQDRWSQYTKIEMKYIVDNMKDVIYIYNNENCSDQIVKAFNLESSDGKEISIYNIAEVTTWKEEAIKDIGGEDAFNQEYGLRFINATRSLLSEHIIENLLNNKKNYSHEKIDEFESRLKFPYDELVWIDDNSIFIPPEKKSVKGVISVDISEGLGQDYSVINIFKISPKSEETIELQHHTYTNMTDFFCLEQIGMFRSNHVSVKQLAELFYVLLFEYFDYENFKVVLELNNYGNEFLAHLPNIFNGNNNYGSSVFFRYKHRVDSTDEKIGLKIGENKNMLVKDYQDSMEKKSIIITNEDNIREITTFVKHMTSAGNIRYAADMGHDDTVMTLVNISSVFSKYEFKEMVEDYAPKLLDPNKISYYRNLLGKVDYVEGIDYQALLNVNKRRRMYDSLISRSTRNIL
jgi:hypothetical protein